MENEAGERSLFKDIFHSTNASSGINLGAGITPDIPAIDRASRLIHQAFELVGNSLIPGTTTQDIADMAEHYLISCGVDPGIIINASVDNVAWHGLPSDIPLAEGSIVSLDIACSLRGWWADAAWTYPVGKLDDDKKRLLCTAWEATKTAITSMTASGSGIKCAGRLAKLCRDRNVSLVSEAAGHGIGRRLHELPTLTYDGRPYTALKSGRVYTAEPVLSLGTSTVVISDQGTAVTIDGSPTAHFEVTVLLLDHGTQVLGNPEWILRKPC